MKQDALTFNQGVLAMQKLIAPIAFWACAAIAVTAAAQTTETLVGKGPGTVGAAQTTKVTATITKIDPATREVTLKGPKGREVTLQLGPEVKNFDQMKVGDTVHAEYLEALTLELKKNGTAVVGRSEQAGAAAAKPGEKPGAVMGRQVTVTAEITALDAQTNTVTLKGPQRTVDVKVADPQRFKLLKVGDKVEATYSEALAIAVEREKK